LRQALAEPQEASRDVADRISKKYSAEAVKADKAARDARAPLAERGRVKPDAKGIVVSLRGELDNIFKRIDLPPSSDSTLWESMFDGEKFKKQMQFLEAHSKTGHCTEQYGEDGSYEGEFLYGMRHGKGTHTFRGETYEGDFKWDQRHGWGVCTLADHTHIRGEWQAGRLHGFASIADSSGKITFEGEFREGKRQGLGRQLFESGDIYDGGWKAGRLHDRGIYYFANGDKVYGMWNQGNYDGVGIFKYADGSASRRVYRDGMLVSVQDFDNATQKFSRTVSREDMMRHTQDPAFPIQSLALSSTP
jgi:hypothetical protein